MHENDHESFYKYFRMTPEQFDNLLLLVNPMLTKKSLYREPISVGERLSVTLRFLATGDSQQTISFSYRIGVFQRIGYFVTSSINKASASEYFIMFHEFVDKIDDRAQHGVHVARDVTRSKDYNWLNSYVNASGREKVETCSTFT